MKFSAFRGWCTILILLAFGSSALAQTRTITTGGNWTNTAIWSGGAIGDVIGETVNVNNDIGGGGLVTVPSPQNYTIGTFSLGNGNDLTIAAGATLNIGNSTTTRHFLVGNDSRLIVSGTLIIWGNLDPGNNFQITINTGGSLIVKGSYTPGNDSQFTSSGTVDVDGAFTLGNNNRITLSGPMDVGGSLTFGNDAVVTLNSPADLNITGNFDGGNNGDFIIGNGASVDIDGFFDLGNDADITINGDVDVAGNFSMGSTPDVSIGSTGDLNVGGNMTANNDGDYIVDGNMHIGGSFNGGTNSDFDVDGLVTITNNITVGNDSNAVGSGTILVGGTCTDGSSTFCGQGPFATLPVKLIYFNVVLNEEVNQTILSWATEKEESFDHFEIEYAASDLQFSLLATVSGAGHDTQSFKKYSWVHSDPILGENYYRLKAVDIDGSFEYFNIRSVTIDGPKELSIYPNPSPDGRVSYKINFEPTPEARIIIMNNLGSELKGIQVTATDSELTFSQPLQSGTYYVRYLSEKVVKVTRLVVR